MKHLKWRAEECKIIVCECTLTGAIYRIWLKPACPVNFWNWVAYMTETMTDLQSRLEIPVT